MTSSVLIGVFDWNIKQVDIKELIAATPIFISNYFCHSEYLLFSVQDLFHNLKVFRQVVRFVSFISRILRSNIFQYTSSKPPMVPDRSKCLIILFLVIFAKVRDVVQNMLELSTAVVVFSFTKVILRTIFPILLFFKGQVLKMLAVHTNLFFKS